MWSSCAGAVTSSAAAPFTKQRFSPTREAFEKEVRSCLIDCVGAQWKSSRKVPPSLLSTEVGLAAAPCRHPRLPGKGQPKVQNRASAM